jgi:ribosomal protein S18 acetylase RimI-like enzyme
MQLLSIHPLTRSDHEWLTQIWREYWGADFIVNLGRIVRPTDVEGFYAANQSERVGLLTYRIEGDQCELVTIDAFTQFGGVGTHLLEAVTKEASAAGCKRLWLITTNDNLDAIRFYQRRGFQLVTIHRNALDRSRELKPSIPLVGEYQIPLRDEIELEIILA